MEAHPFLAELQRLESVYLQARDRDTLDAAEIAGQAAHGLRASWRWPLGGPDGLWLFVASFSVDGEDAYGLPRIADCQAFWAREFLDQDDAVFAIADRFAPICPVFPYANALQDQCPGCNRTAPLVLNQIDTGAGGIRRIYRHLYVLCTDCQTLFVFGRGTYVPDAN